MALAIFCDLSKAFDVIDHEMLLHKLNANCIRSVVKDWFGNYLYHRKQFVYFEGRNSPIQDIVCGVPQYSILGPLLYLIYM